MTIKQLYYFTVTAKAGSFGRAAELLDINARSLRIALKELESTLGFALFREEHKTLQMTDNGKMFVTKAEKALLDFGALKALVPENDHFTHTAQPAQSIFSNPACMEAMVGPLVSELYDRYPQIPLVLQEKSHETIFEALAANPQALGIVTIASDYFAQTFRRQYKGSLEWETLCLEEIMAVVSDKSPLAHRSSIPLAEYLTYPLALNGHFEFEWMKDLGIALPQALSICLSSSNLELLWQFIAADRAVGFVATYLSGQRFLGKHLVTVPFKERPSLMLMTIQAKEHQPTLAENILIHALRSKILS